MEHEALFLAALPVIDDVTEQVCRRHRMSRVEAEDFRSEVRLHFLQDDCDVLRRFQGRSSLATYVTVVIQRRYLDHRNREWGRWRPSSEARRLGQDAILYERLVSRDGWSSDQAIEVMRVNHGIDATGTAAALAARQPRHAPPRRRVGEDEAGQIESPGSRSDANVVRAEHGFLVRRVQAALDRAREALSAEEALVLKMRFEDAMSVADVARALNLNQKRLYRTIERILARLFESLQAEGISHADAQAFFEDPIVACVGDGDASVKPSLSADQPPAVRVARAATPQ